MGEGISVRYRWKWRNIHLIWYCEQIKFEAGSRKQCRVWPIMERFIHCWFIHLSSVYPPNHLSIHLSTIYPLIHITIISPFAPPPSCPVSSSSFSFCSPPPSLGTTGSYLTPYTHCSLAMAATFFPSDMPSLCLPCGLCMCHSFYLEHLSPSLTMAGSSFSVKSQLKCHPLGGAFPDLSMQSSPFFHFLS